MDPRTQSLLDGCSHYARSDRALFVAGYNELCRVDLTGKKVLELCCGYGELALALARLHPAANVVALDRHRQTAEAIQTGEVKNLKHVCGDALRLEEFPDNSFDLIYGQATLHHLANDPAAVGIQCARLLKPGGRLMFINEPLGHNPLFAMIRAYRVARKQMEDESNLFLKTIERVGQEFSTCEVQVFNFLCYPLKFLGKWMPYPIIDFVHRLDAALMRSCTGMARMAANCNIVFTR